MNSIVESRSLSQAEITDRQATLGTDLDTSIQFGIELNIAWHAIVRGLNGVAVATKAADGEVSRIAEAITAVIGMERCASLSPDQGAINYSVIALPLRDWHAHIIACALEPSQRHRANLALAMAFLCLAGRQDIDVPPVDLNFVWSLVREALASPSIPYTISRSAQGFLAVPLWSLIKDGNIDELFRLHVWLPDGQRGITDLAVHSHQAFAQSWILAGEGRDHTYEVQPADTDTATHAEFGLSWSDSSGKETGKKYQTHQKSSTVANTGKLVRVWPAASQTHARNTTYTVPAGAFHRSDVPPDALHATLFFFDAHRGFQQVAPVLGPVDGEPYTQQRGVTGATPATLADMVEAARKREIRCGHEVQKADLSRAHEPIHRCEVSL